MVKIESAKGHVKETRKIPSLVASTGKPATSVMEPDEGSIESKELVRKITQVMSPEKRSCVIPKVKLLFGNVLTSAHNIHSESILISDSKGNLSEQQVVVAVGGQSLLKVGDWVKINIDMFPRETKPGKHDVGNQVIIHPPIERIGSSSYFLITDRHIKYIIDK